MLPSALWGWGRLCRARFCPLRPQGLAQWLWGWAGLPGDVMLHINTSQALFVFALATNN